MTLDLTPLEKGVSQLEKSLAYLDSDLARQDQGLREQFRAAAIQAAEFTYELCWRTLKRYLDLTVASPSEVDALTFKDWFRIGAEKGLVADPEAWFCCREKPNITVHTYDAATAEEVLAVLPPFARDARDLLSRLRKR
jgi:nucleotidyltransferase substrate binding protein (TIGR01987 family)